MGATQRLRILHHGNCLDGCASAGLFLRFYEQFVAPGVSLNVSFAGLDHRAGGSAIPGALLDGDVNAVVDFRYARDPRLHWWFDHHLSAFPSEGDQAHFQSLRDGRKFYDAQSRSCAGFMARILASQYGFDLTGLSDLLHWVEIVDGALFSSAQEAVELREPALKLMMWVEHNRDVALEQRLIRDLPARPLAEIVATPYVQEALGPILDGHRRNIELVRRHAHLVGRVILLDLLGHNVPPINKFIAYFLLPEARYSVTLQAGDDLVRVSVGSNPWATVPRGHNIAQICERYGGGGHAVVGAVSLPRDGAARARAIAAEIVDELER